MTHLILIGGLAAAGKTTLGREMARITKFAFLDKDTMTQPLVEALLSALEAPGGVDDRHSDVYIGQVRPYEYESFLNTMKENVTLGVSTVAVAPFLREMADKRWLSRLEEQLPEAKIHQIWMNTPEITLYQRIVSRCSARDRQKLDNWTEYMNACRKIQPCGSCVLVEPCTNEGTENLAARVLEGFNIAYQIRR